MGTRETQFSGDRGNSTHSVPTCPANTDGTQAYSIRKQYSDGAVNGAIYRAWIKKESPMDEADALEPNDLERRQLNARARRRREDMRLATLGKFVEAKRRADELRNWILAYAKESGGSVQPELRRMLQWAEVRLAELDQFIDPDRLTTMLLENDLFPEVDPLSDPLGEPPRDRAWSRPTSLRNINAV
jgi:hypothetical protein